MEWLEVIGIGFDEEEAETVENEITEDIEKMIQNLMKEGK